MMFANAVVTSLNRVQPKWQATQERDHLGFSHLFGMTHPMETDRSIQSQ